MVVRELELDLDAFEGPFDLLLTLVLREELDLAEIDVAAIVVAFVELLAEREELDLEACGEFLVLVAALLELKARALFPDEDAELADLGPEEAAEELARRLAEYRRMKEAAALARRAPRRHARPVLPARPGTARAAAGAEARAAGPGRSSPRRCARSPSSPPQVSLSHMALRFPPVSLFVERFRALLQRRRALRLRPGSRPACRASRSPSPSSPCSSCASRDEIAIQQAAPFAPIRIARADVERSLSWNVRSA